MYHLFNHNVEFELRTFRNKVGLTCSQAVISRLNIIVKIKLICIKDFGDGAYR